MNTRGLGIALVFVAGCAVGGASARFVVPPASAQQAATLTKWEYTCFSKHAGEDDTEKKANAAGLQGWEMVGSLSHGYDAEWCFKRPKMWGRGTHQRPPLSQKSTFRASTCQHSTRQRMR